MRPGLDAIRSVAVALGDPQKSFPALHVAGTNGKGAVCAILDACLRSAGFSAARYTSPHLVAINERFFVGGRPVDNSVLEAAASKVRAVAPEDMTFFEALTAVAFVIFAESQPHYAVVETGLGGRLDATNICRPAVSVITRIGRDHCEWLGETLPEIAAEKAGIAKSGVPLVLGRNNDEVKSAVSARAREAGAPFFYAPDLADESEIPAGFSLSGSFNMENAVTAIAALKVLLAARSGSIPPADQLAHERLPESVLRGMADVDWPGRFQRVGRFLVDGAHNPPAATALAAALARAGVPRRSLTLVAGFCADKEVDDVLRILAPFAARGAAVATNNPRSLSANEVAERMERAGIRSIAYGSLAEAIAAADEKDAGEHPCVLVCGSLFLAGEALALLGALPHGVPARFDPAERLA